jgi:aldehyde dehydrogenase (NAD+)
MEEVMDIQLIVKQQKRFFDTGKTRNIPFRLKMLNRLQQAILEMEDEIGRAVWQDLGKSASEAYMCETGLVLSEISYMKKKLRGLAAPRMKWTPLAQFPSASYVLREPYGCVLVMSPWNYPFLLTLEPLVDAIAAGNTAVVKPSAYTPQTSAVIEKLLQKCFPEKYVAVVTGGRKENADLLEQEFDYIFFTGGTTVGRLVAEKAAAHFTPVTLEMGGKSPCIVDETANLRVAAKRIAFGKYLNCGQTCVAPDYLLISEKVKDRFLALLKAEIKHMYGINAFQNEHYGKIINEKHYDRLMGLLEGQEIYYGGRGDRAARQIEPTILVGASPDSAVMQEEIFGPILPVLTYRHIEEAVSFVKKRPKPLALYLFSQDRSTISRIEKQVSFGGGCINDTIIHLATSEMPFGGVGNSGMGKYHGKYGFETFSHEKSIVDKSTLVDLPIRYQPYNEVKDWLVHRFMR